MIKQGTNNPITIIFTYTPTDVSVALVNEIQTLKHWAMDDLVDAGDGLTFTCPISQEESMQWEEGPCVVEVRWVDSEGDKAGIVQKRVIHEYIEYTRDTEILELM